MTDFDSAVDALMTAASSGHPVEQETLQQRAEVVVQAGLQVDEATRSQAVGRMVDTILGAPLPRAAMVALVCGAMVEQGAHPYAALHAVITRLGDLLGEAAAFVERCRELADADGVDTDDPVGLYGGQAARTASAGAVAYESLDAMVRPAVAMISRSKRARRAANDEGRMAARARRFPMAHPMVDWLVKLLNVVDDDTLLVLHPAERLGWQVTISGIVTNVQLVVLLEAVLSEAGLRADAPPEGVVTAATQQVNPSPQYTLSYGLWQADALDTDGVLDDASAVRLDEPPTVINRVDGERVVLLADAPAPRTYSIIAPFAGLQADLYVSGILSPRDVQARLADLHERIRAKAADD